MATDVQVEDGPSISSAVACRIAHIDRIALSAAITDGFFPRIKSNGTGSGRRFGISEVVALIHYSSMLRYGFSRRCAGRFTALILEQLRKDPEVGCIQIRLEGHGSDPVVSGGNSFAMNPREPGGESLHVMAFNTGEARRKVEDALEREGDG